MNVSPLLAVPDGFVTVMLLAPGVAVLEMEKVARS